MRPSAMAGGGSAEIPARSAVQVGEEGAGGDRVLT
jgi:hypothetical protein